MKIVCKIWFVLFSFLSLISCAPYYKSFNKNTEIEGCVIYTTFDLLNIKGENISPSPPIEYYFVPDRYISIENDNYCFKQNPVFYEIAIYNPQIKKIVKEGDTIFISKDKYFNISQVLRCKILLKKGLSHKLYTEAQKKFFSDKEPCRISLNPNDTINIFMNYDYQLVNYIKELK